MAQPTTKAAPSIEASGAKPNPVRLADALADLTSELRGLVGIGGLAVRGGRVVAAGGETDGLIRWAKALDRAAAWTGMSQAALAKLAIAGGGLSLLPEPDHVADLGTGQAEAAEPPADRRLRRVWLTEAERDCLLRHDDAPKRSALLVALGLPKDIEALREDWSPERFAFAMTLRSAEFEAIAVGNVVPFVTRADRRPEFVSGLWEDTPRRITPRDAPILIGD